MQGQSSVGLAGAAKDLVHEALRRQIHSSQGAVQPPRLKGRVYGGRRGMVSGPSTMQGGGKSHMGEGGRAHGMGRMGNCMAWRLMSPP